MTSHLVEHAAQHLCGHDEAGRLRVDLHVTSQQPNLGGGRGGGQAAGHSRSDWLQGRHTHTHTHTHRQSCRQSCRVDQLPASSGDCRY
jgi:hypothetical protein